MTHVVSVEANAHLPPLLERVANGERIVITDRGRPVAVLGPPEADALPGVAEVGRQMLAYRDRVKRELGGSFRELARDGHKY